MKIPITFVPTGTVAREPKLTFRATRVSEGPPGPPGPPGAGASGSTLTAMQIGFGSSENLLTASQTFTLGAEGSAVYIQGKTATTAGAAGCELQIIGGDGNGNAPGGGVWLVGGDGRSGGSIDISAGDATATGAGNGGFLYLNGGDALGGNKWGGAVNMYGGDADGSGQGGDVAITGGAAPGSGAGGSVHITPGTSSSGARGIVTINDLPTSSAGLPSGALWRDAGAANVLKVVP